MGLSVLCKSGRPLHGQHGEGSGYILVAMHPYLVENWNRCICYNNMGSKRFHGYQRLTRAGMNFEIISVT